MLPVPTTCRRRPTSWCSTRTARSSTRDSAANRTSRRRLRKSYSGLPRRPPRPPALPAYSAAVSLAAAMTDALLEVIAPALAARFRIERQLGRGGMGTVYLATDLAHERPIALKVLDPALGAAIGADRFVREVQLTARLQHPHICALYDSGEISVPEGPSHLWYSMPYLPGGSLAGRLRRDGRLSIADAVRIARETAAGLAYAHRHGVLHRDVKPGNILLSDDGHAQVADFGIARAVDQQSDAGEPDRL